MKFSRSASLAVLATALVAVTGCSTSPIPLAKNFELTTQKKVRSAGHWDLLARDVVAQTQASLDTAGAAPTMGMYVALPDNPSTFDKAFRDFVITKLVQSGKPVFETAGSPLQVSYKAQLVKHRSPRPDFYPGRFTILTAGLMAAYGLHAEHLDAQLAGALVAAGGADYWASKNSGGPTATELILTTTVTRGGQYLTRKTDVYYIESEDAPLFVDDAYKSLNMKVVSQ